ncbi:MAG: SHOCT domain-containing protein [Deltaproteobacteria bacterium]|nr:SHOCT domain-containing protein [Deltaproteobacteria bacterium]MBW2394894.1 SHOCT domain-containing protein [Deltaproteobacteria bacterium]
MEAHLHGCKVNTFWLWPFDWASKCMRRRGYELREIGDSDPAQMMESSSSSAAQNLLQLKQLRDSGAITAEEYDEKRKKYLDDL